MSIDPQVLRSERYSEIGHVIRRDVQELVDRWARRAALDQPNAVRLHHATLLDHLPRFLEALAHSLAGTAAADVLSHRIPALEHGADRWENGWSLTEVVRDYQILRLVLLEHLERRLERPMRFREVQAVGLALDEAIETSVAAYIAHRDEYVRRIEQERAEQRRAAEAARLAWEHIFRSAGWGVALLAAETPTFQTVNPAFARMHGYSADELVGRPLADLLAPETRDGLAELLAEADTRGDHTFEAVHLRRNGERFPGRTHLSAIRDDTGRLLYRAQSLQDVSDFKKLEESLRAQAEALRESDQRKNEFLAMLAHELRNPLAPIQNAVAVLRLLGPADGDTAEARAIVERQIKQLVRLVDDLLDVSRIAQGKVELRRSRFDLAQAVAEAVQTTAALFEAQGHQLELSVPEAPLPLEADEARVVQVLVNLLNNAAKYTDCGGHVRLTVRREGGEAVIAVQDDGVGIEPAMLGKVFDLFTQIEGARDRSQGGLGIGLTLVRQLVELHGGRVSVRSEGKGKGSTFEVRLPALPSAATATTATATADVTPGGRHVLIVEDNADARETLAKLLSLLGHRVDTAATGPEGVERALTLKPEIALVDLGLPGLDGVQVARRLRKALGQSIQLVALSGHARDEDRQRSKEAGFDMHLAKPVEVEELTRLLCERRASPA
jgi:PAS domain S-box-containing protein